MTSSERDTGDLPTVTVVIPVYNDGPRLRTCLTALLAQDYPADRFDVVVADNASTEDLRPFLPDDPRFQLVFEGRRGSYAARNTAVEHARGQVLAFTDGDCIPRPDWLSKGVAALFADPAPDAVGGAINLTFRDGGGPTTAPEHYEAFHGFEQQKYVERFSFAATANLFVRAETFRAVGPFNAALKSGGDLDWGTRLGESGRTLVYAPEAVIDHPSRPTWRELTTKSIRVANGLADLAASLGRRTIVARAVRELRGGLLVWVKVWGMDRPARSGEKLRYAAAYSYVSALRTVVRLRRLLGGGRGVRDPQAAVG